MNNKNLIIMMKDTPIMRVDFSEGIYEVLDQLHLPYPLKGRIKPIPALQPGSSRYDMTQAVVAMNNNNSAVTSWLANRVLPLSRKNAKWIYNALKVEQLNSDIEKAKVSVLCRSVSLLDNYWVKQENESVKWKDVDIRQNHLNEILTQIALHGASLTLEGSLCSPEMTTHGAYAKAWKRENGELYLYKMGANGWTESKIEVMTSNLLDKMNVTHLKYEAAESNGEYCCKCKCMTTSDLSILSGMDFTSYCNVNGLDPDAEMMKIDAESIYKMWIVDYLISNRDRHGLNWGFYYDSETMAIKGCHPLYDHNNAFDIEYMRNKNADYQFGNGSIRQAAEYAMKKVDFHFTDEITRADFLTDRQYDSFMGRARDLHIELRREKESAGERDAFVETLMNKARLLKAKASGGSVLPESEKLLCNNAIGEINEIIKTGSIAEMKAKLNGSNNPYVKQIEKAINSRTEEHKSQMSHAD